ncbi:hypothetical protein PV11_03985 [Exophiala sideris]|uniref:Fe2OG dioxygenase domain-containing protein n=1 Tax=Exophiala sideris TaxID=1016849 RepID=A0A0D1YL82_9EURO|nr:hypothetical protein PV11_03985 [Exophiala sideris]
MLFPTDSLPKGPPVETKQALILLDLQNDFVSLDGKMPVANVLPFLPNLIPLVAEFREKGEVIWVGTEYKHPRSDLSPITGSHSILLKHFLEEKNGGYERSQCLDDPRNARSPSEDPLAPSEDPDVTHDREAFLAPVLTMTRYRCCISGSVGIQYPDAIKAAMNSQRDLVMLKSYYSAFVDTSLLMHLRTRLITKLYICGSLSNISVYATVLDAVCHGLQVSIIEDCLGYNDESCHVEAVRRMADDMGAKGIDSQELRDDLAGLLGDVIREEDFTTKFEVSLPPPTRRSKSHTSKERVHDWMSRLDGEDSRAASFANDRNQAKSGGEIATVGSEASKINSDSSAKSTETTSHERSPSRKRSTSDLEPLEEDRSTKLSHKPSSRRSSDNNNPAEQSKRKQNRSTTRQRRPPSEVSTRSATSGTIKVMTERPMLEDPLVPNDLLSDYGQPHTETDLTTTVQSQGKAPKKNKKLSPNILEPNDKIGQGDCHVCLELLDETEGERAFYSCRKSIKWQKMFHKSGAVPRLVAIQGDISDDNSLVPIYRHPADESPELLPFDPIVDMLRKAAEKAVGHPLNHALIQMYRNSEDNISEHSDKTLDIVRGSKIVNLSLGAQRTMILRMKKSATTAEADTNETRPSQRIQLPHNSLFILGQETNQHWLHSIRADKRPASEKDLAELAFGGERISLTFRYIGTFINPAEKTIWGQGATSKQKSAARKLSDGLEAEKQGEEMIRAFSHENHRSSDWNWDEWYGKGFDVVNFETKTADVDVSACVSISGPES